MIEKLQIRNYGANENIDIEFSPQVTTIVGKSFIGKSWILRALRWVCRNKPAGTSFIKWESERANNRLTVDNQIITRTRSKSINTYKLNNKDPYKAFGNDVPKDIAEILNLSDINFQGVNILGQHEPPFWFCKTAGEVSRELNAIVNLNIIDSTLTNISSKINETKMRIKIIQDNLGRAIERKKSLAYINDLNIKLVSIEEFQKVSQKKATEYVRIASLLETGAKYRQTRDNARAVVSEGQIVLAKGKIHQNLESQAQTLYQLMITAKEFQTSIKQRPPSFKPIEKLKKTMDTLFVQYENLCDIIKIIKSSQEKKCRTKENLKTLKAEFKKMAVGLCPICGKPMKK